MIVQLVLVFGLNVKVPTHTTIRNWVCKCGYHRGVAGHGLKDYDAATRWGLWIDESMTMGGQKLLLILGRPVNNWAFEESLSMATIHVLYLNFAEQWLATDIAPILKNIDEVHKIAYIVSDNGVNLVKSYEIGGFIHISDLTHTFANGLERHYKKNDGFNSLFSGCTALRQKWTMSKTKSTYMPPSQRGKVRFANIFPTILWAHALPSKKEALPLEIQPDMAFIFEHQALTNELYEVHRVIGAISTILKISGFSVANTAAVEMLLATLSDTPSIRLFVAEIYKWLNATEVLRQKTGLETIFCCSDIIESTFGKFKQKTNVKSSFGMTEFVLIIANFGQDFSTQEIRDALEQVKLETIADWRPDIKSIFQKKKTFFQK
jgi:hypothetical protein